MVHLVFHDRHPGRRQLWDVLLGLVEVGHGGVQAAPGVLLRVVHLQSRRGAVSVLDYKVDVCKQRLYGNTLTRMEKVRQVL